MNANRPRGTRQLIPRSASTVRSPLWYDFRTPTTSIIAPPARSRLQASCSVRPDPDRVHGNQPRRAPCGIETAECPRHHRQRDAKREEPGGDLEPHAAGDEL